MKNGNKTEIDPKWQTRYADAIMTADKAIALIQPGHRIFVGTGCAQPLALTRALAARAHDLPDTEIVHLLTAGEAPYAREDIAKCFRVNTFFISANVRDLVQRGMGDYTPMSLSDIPRFFASGRFPLDVAMIQVGPPDLNGKCSLGVSVDIVKSAAENASFVIAQVNPRMPRTLGDSFLNVYDLDVLVPSDDPIIEYAQPKPSEAAEHIGEYVAALIDDGCTVQLGIGQIPQSIPTYLKNKHDIGIHTEMLTDSIIDLVESGVVTGKCKTFDTGKVVASFCMGSQKLYDYIDNNPAFAFFPTEYVNDPFNIKRHNRMVAVNMALEIDLTGQVCSDSIGSKFYSGIGGQTDFNRGAAASAGGKAIIALPSTAEDGKVSRIVPFLTSGAGVVVTRGDVHYVATEYGVAYLPGKSVQERAIALISIAHPDFRERLLDEAIRAKYVRPEMADVEGQFFVGPQEIKTSMLLSDGTQVFFRPVHPTDEHRMKDLFYALSRSTIYYRFMSHIRRLPAKEIQNFVFVNHRNDVAIVGTLPEAHGEAIIAIGRYYLDPKTNRAEVAFVVHDKWQRRGIGSFLFKYLASIALRNGIAGFTAETLKDNKPMLAILNNSGYKLHSALRESAYSISLDFE